MTLYRLIALISIIVGGTGSLFASSYCVRAAATGNQSGSDWTNAYTQLPAKLIRGSTYYVAAGTYPPHTFADANDGTKIIEIRAATPTDHGIQTGWSSAYTGQAVFQSNTAIPCRALWYFRTDYYFINGKYRGADWQSGYGLKLDNSGKKATVACILIGDSNPTVVHDITIQFVEISGSHPTGDACNEQGVYSPSGSYNLTFRNLYNHDVGNCNFFMRGGGGTNGKGSNITVEYCYITDNYSSPTVHGEGFSCSEGLKNFTVRYNYIVDMVGTAYIATPSGGGWNTTNINNGPWYIYGNVFHASDRTHCGTGNGALFFFDVNFTGNVYIYNNTFSRLGSANCTGAYNGGILIQPVQGSQKADMKGVYLTNNLWYNVSDLTLKCSTCSVFESTFNAYYSMADNSAAKDADINRQVSPHSPIADWQNNNFKLITPTAMGKLLPRTYDQDIFGVSRSADSRWDRGAVEYTGGPISTRPAVPVPTAQQHGPDVDIHCANATIAFSYELGAACPVAAELFNAVGKRVAFVSAYMQDPGTHRLRINGKGLSRGLYVYRMTQGDRIFSDHLLIQ